MSQNTSSCVGKTLTNLPDELLVKIIVYLDHQDLWYLHKSSDTPLKNLSAVFPRFRFLLLPQLFGNLSCIYCPLRDEDNQHFYDSTTISTILQQPHLVSYTKTLHLELIDVPPPLQVHDKRSHYRPFFDIISGLPHLEHITLDISDRAIPEVKEAIDAIPSTLKLERVKSLDVTLRAAFLVAHCPNVKNLRLSGFANQIRPCRLSPASTVKHLTIEGPLFGSSLWDIAVAFPSVEHLVRQSFGNYSDMPTSSHSRYSARFATLFEKLKSMEWELSYIGRSRARTTGVVETNEMGERQEVWQPWQASPARKGIWDDEEDGSDGSLDGEEDSSDDEIEPSVKNEDEYLVEDEEESATRSRPPSPASVA
jgi:hypothetical protein